MANNRNVVALISYITWVGFLIAFLMGDRSDRFFTHHLNQAQVLNIASIVGGVLSVLPLVGGIATSLVSLAVFVLDIMGILSAYRGSTDPLPIVGDIHLMG
jgi:uncharacterized membrane protein